MNEDNDDGNERKMKCSGPSQRNSIPKECNFMQKYYIINIVFYYLVANCSFSQPLKFLLTKNEEEEEEEMKEKPDRKLKKWNIEKYV